MLAKPMPTKAIQAKPAGKQLLAKGKAAVRSDPVRSGHSHAHPDVPHVAGGRTQLLRLRGV